MGRNGTNLRLKKNNLLDLRCKNRKRFAEDLIMWFHAFKLRSKFKYTVEIKGAKFSEDNRHGRLCKELSKSIGDYFELVLPVEG
ncbi:hypothetical protein HZU67_07790 [Apis mellifera carnica]|nr:hypothetical protein HZU67_07790 [Apis mellifera carnica]